MATIQGVYVALFGRPADPAGLAYFNGITNNGQDLAAIANLAGQPEFKDRFDGQSNAQIVNSIYQSLFNRDAEAAGLNFFVDKLNKGELNVNNIAIAILDGAQGDDKELVAIKIAAADLFTSSLTTPVEIAAYSGDGANAIARTWLAGVTAEQTQADVDTVINDVVINDGAGATIEYDGTLVATPTVITTTTSNAVDGVKTTNKNDTINADDNWDPTADTIDGGLGRDTLNATVTGLDATTGKVRADGLKGVEVVNLTAATTDSIVDFTEAAGLEQVWNVGSDANLDVIEIDTSVAVGVRGDLNTTTFTVEYAEVGGTSDEASVVLEDAVDGTLDIADIETINLSSTGDSDVTLADDAKTLNISGSGTLVLAGSSAATVDASGFAGDLEFDFTNTGLKSYSGATGTDTIVLGNGLDNNATINAGEGDDFVTLSAAANDKTTAITLGDGADILTVNGAGNATVGTNADLLKGLVSVTDFSASDDALIVDFGSDYDALLTAQQTQVSGKATLLEAANTAALAIDVGGDYTIFNWKGDAYILEVTGAGVFADGDSLIKLVGIQVGDLNDDNFQG